MTKILPIDTVIMLHNKLGALTARNPLRKLIIEEAATFYGVSSSTIYRLLQKYDKLYVLLGSFLFQIYCIISL